MDNYNMTVMRLMAWERAKAELKTMLWTLLYTNADTVEQTKKLDALITAFVEDVESEDLHD